MSIKIIITGGTIDDLEYESVKDAPKEHKSLIPELLNQARVTLDITIDELLQKTVAISLMKIVNLLHKSVLRRQKIKLSLHTAR